MRLCRAMDRKAIVAFLLALAAVTGATVAVAASERQSRLRYTYDLTRVGHRVVFIGVTRRSDTLWVSDLTPGGTRPIPAVSGGLGPVISAGSYALVPLSNDRGDELWRTDGTPSGTRRIAQGSLPSIDYTFTRVGDRVFWIGPEYPGGSTRFDAYLWTSDGTKEGTRRLAWLETSQLGFKDEYGGYQLLAYRRMVIVRTRTGDVWRSDGTEGGTIRLATGAGFLQGAGGRVWFVARDQDHGREPWLTDGTQAGTRMLADICPGPCDWHGYGWAVARDGRMVFTADGGSHGVELWVTDGTEAGTRMLADICPGPCSSHPWLLRETVGGRLILTADDGTDGREPWVTDGTEARTRQLRDLCPGRCSSQSNSPPYPSDSVAAEGDRLYFDAYQREHGWEPWVTDGTKAGTSLLRDICRGKCSSGAGPLGTVATATGRLVFGAYDGHHGTEPWLTDGTRPGTRMLRDICPGKCGSAPDGPSPAVNGRRLFNAEVHGDWRPWVVDETSRKTFPLRSVVGPMDMQIRIGGVLVFNMMTTPAVWRTDGTNAGTVMLTHR